MAMTLLADNTADTTDLASVEFTSGIDSTYKLYIFKFYDVNPATDNVDFTFNGSVDGGSNYNVTKTTTWFEAYHGVDGASTTLTYGTAYDLAEATGYQILARGAGNGADESSAGELFLFNPASTTYVKHFYSTVAEHQYYSNNQFNNNFIAGYCNTTSAVDAIQFKMSSGNFDGTIKMWGLKN